MHPKHGVIPFTWSYHLERMSIFPWEAELRGRTRRPGIHYSNLGWLLPRQFDDGPISRNGTSSVGAPGARTPYLFPCLRPSLDPVLA